MDKNRRTAWTVAKYIGLVFSFIYMLQGVQTTGAVQLVNLTFMAINMAIAFWADSKLKADDKEKLNASNS